MTYFFCRFLTILRCSSHFYAHYLQFMFLFIFGLRTQGVASDADCNVNATGTVRDKYIKSHNLRDMQQSFETFLSAKRSSFLQEVTCQNSFFRRGILSNVARNTSFSILNFVSEIHNVLQWLCKRLGVYQRR